MENTYLFILVQKFTIHLFGLMTRINSISRITIIITLISHLGKLAHFRIIVSKHFRPNDQLLIIFKLYFTYSKNHFLFLRDDMCAIQRYYLKIIFQFLIICSTKKKLQKAEHKSCTNLKRVGKLINLFFSAIFLALFWVLLSCLQISSKGLQKGNRFIFTRLSS